MRIRAILMHVQLASDLSAHVRRFPFLPHTPEFHHTFRNSLRINTYATVDSTELQVFCNERL
jgi:hypothetical protein